MEDEISDASRRSFLGASAALLAASGSSAQTTPELPSVLRDVTVSTIADALRQVGENPLSLSMTPDIKPLTQIGRTVIGPAVTTKWQSGLGRMTPDDVRKYMFEPLDDAASGSIWVVAGGTTRMLSLFGSVIGVACKQNGMLAAVTDNACRDLDAFAELEFPVFAKASVPYGPADIAKPVAANVPVKCGGVEVGPLDFIAADVDGVIVIPGKSYEDVMEATTDILRKEQRVLEKLAAGESLASAYTI